MATVTITIAGLGYTLVTDPRALHPGDWLLFTRQLGDTGTITHLTVLQDCSHHPQAGRRGLLLCGDQARRARSS
ncbi:hypothetical protein ACIQVK_18990 [Streptomyces sp. NPDC090493]|uniref:hypothetical protein n=1 Tax=Streptomyces sp. NPDC090493 TaxID=3365964 RepID=UPI003809DBF1